MPQLLKSLIRPLAMGLLLACQHVPIMAAEKTKIPPQAVSALQQAHVPLDAVSIMITPLATDGPSQTTLPPRLSHRATAAMNPASVMKLITTYAGLSLLGPDYTWRNRVYMDGTLRNGVLQGDLIFKGSGDPKLVLEHLQTLMAQIQAQGVREVRGDLVLDRSVFDIQPRAPGSFDDEALRPYNAAPDGLLVNFKSLIYSFNPDPIAGVARISSEPPLAGLTVTPSVPLGNGPCNDWRSSVRGQFGSPVQVNFGGVYPTSCGEKKWPVAYADPASYAPRAIQGLWLSMGGQLSGTVRYGQVPAALLAGAPTLELRSPPLGEIVRDINKYSNNVMAQQLFLTLGREGTGAVATPDAARAVV